MSTKFLRVFVIVATVVLAGLLAAAVWLTLEDEQIKFQDVTIELGTETVTISQFLTEHGDPARAHFVSDVSVIDLSKAGSYDLTLTDGRREQTVKFTIEDTTPPEVVFDERIEFFADKLPTADAFVTSVKDFSATTVSFLQEPVANGMNDVPVTVVVTDSSGNKTQANCTLVYAWLKESYSLEYGNTLTAQDLLFDPSLGAELLDQSKLDEINAGKVGTYTISSTYQGKTQTCTVTVQDTTAPVLKLREVVTAPGSKKNMDAFLESVSDASEGTRVSFATEPEFDSLGHFTVTVVAEDPHGNIARQDTLLVVSNDLEAPVITGADKALSITKTDKVDLMAGISATDAVDGVCEVKVDTSEFDQSLGGTQYVVYTAMDKSHNVTTIKRTVNIAHDEADTTRLVNEIANTLSDDLVELCMYVNKKVRYTHNWGGDDPVWYGFTNRNGNCYVQAVCLKALYDAKGIECQLAWVTNKTHYWVIVKTPEGKWRHIDPTPGDMHLSMGLMTDKQRQITLSGGRTWDKTQWPACE